MQNETVAATDEQIFYNQKTLYILTNMYMYMQNELSVFLPRFPYMALTELSVLNETTFQNLLAQLESVKLISSTPMPPVGFETVLP